MSKLISLITVVFLTFAYGCSDDTDKEKADLATLLNDGGPKETSTMDATDDSKAVVNDASSEAMSDGVISD